MSEQQVEERTYPIYVCIECGDQLAELRSDTGYCYTHGRVQIRVIEGVDAGSLTQLRNRISQLEAELEAAYYNLGVGGAT